MFFDKKMRAKIILPLPISLSLLFIIGCSDYKMDPSKHIKILVCPSIDARTEKNLVLDKFDKNGCYLKNRVWPAEEILKIRFYYIPRHLSDPTSMTITYDELKNHNIERLKSLKKHGMRYVLVIVINKFHSEFTIVHDIKVEVEGYLIDTDIGDIIWYNMAENTSVYGGLLNPFLFWHACDSPPMIAMNSAISHLLVNLPILKPEISSNGE